MVIYPSAGSPVDQRLYNEAMLEIERLQGEVKMMKCPRTLELAIEAATEAKDSRGLRVRLASLIDPYDVAKNLKFLLEGALDADSIYLAHYGTVPTTEESRSYRAHALMHVRLLLDVLREHVLAGNFPRKSE